MNNIYKFLALTCLAIAGCESFTPTDTALPSRTDSLQIYAKVFTTPESCQPCHPRQYSEWSMSMHAFSITDPVFLALNANTLDLTNGMLGEYCVQCHAPVATQLNELNGGIVRANLSTQSRGGVTCDACHKSEAQSPGHGISKFRLDGVMYGTIKNPVSNSFHASEYNQSFEQSQSCSGCHDLISTSGVTVEETYSEWQRSFFSMRNIQCQTCHMKWDSGQAAVGGPATRRVHSHLMTGVDVPLTDFPGREEMIANAAYLLNNSVHTEFLPPQSILSGQTLPLKFEITNSITGHSVPSAAYFIRQMWVQVDVTNERGDTLFSSGMLDPNSDLLDENSDFVKKGQLPIDSNLVIFNGTVYRHGKVASTVWNADAFINHSIPVNGTRIASYKISAPVYRASTVLTVNMKLLMRALPPYLLRAINRSDLVSKLPIFTMETKSAVIEVLK